jgi:hypothetical protein
MEEACLFEFLELLRHRGRTGLVGDEIKGENMRGVYVYIKKTVIRKECILFFCWSF